MGLTELGTEPWDGAPEGGAPEGGPQHWDADRGRPFAPTGAWGDGIEGRCLSSSSRSDVPFQQERE